MRSERATVRLCVEILPASDYAQFNGGQIMDFGGCKSWSHRLCLIS
jgi:hypothetical protein